MLALALFTNARTTLNYHRARRPETSPMQGVKLMENRADMIYCQVKQALETYLPRLAPQRGPAKRRVDRHVNTVQAEYFTFDIATRLRLRLAAKYAAPPSRRKDWHVTPRKQREDVRPNGLGQKRPIRPGLAKKQSEQQSELS
jgi:hypothetical protein